MCKEQVVSTANLAALDTAIDAVAEPRFIVVSQWIADFIRADKRKRGRLIRKRRKQRKIGLPINDGPLYIFESLKLRQE